MVNAGSRFVVASSGVKRLSCNIGVYIQRERERESTHRLSPTPPWVVSFEGRPKIAHKNCFFTRHNSYVFGGLACLSLASDFGHRFCTVLLLFLRVRFSTNRIVLRVGFKRVCGVGGRGSSHVAQAGGY